MDKEISEVWDTAAEVAEKFIPTSKAMFPTTEVAETAEESSLSTPSSAVLDTLTPATVVEISRVILLVILLIADAAVTVVKSFESRIRLIGETVEAAPIVVEN